MVHSKAKQILLNEARKIRVKIDSKNKEVMKLEAELKELEASIDSIK